MSARNGRPWYRNEKNSWYCWIHGKQTALGVRGASSEREAIRAWHLRMTGAPPKPQPCLPTPLPCLPVLTVKSLVDAFLADAETRLKAATVKLYTDNLKVLVGEFGTADAGKITHQQLSLWLLKSWGNSTTKAIRIRSCGACFGWAVRQDLLEKNPVVKVAKPRGQSRADAVITPEEHGKLLAAAAPCFRPVLEILWATGCRPSEACSMTVENFDVANSVVVLKIHKNDRHGKPRLIFLTPAVCDLLKILAAKVGAGHLLLSRGGVAWTAANVTHAMWRLRKATGVKKIAYGYRHTFATRALSRGVPDSHVAGLLGHSSTAMVHKHYSHLTSQADVLRAALDKTV